jgi:hypothetical protein
MERSQWENLNHLFCHKAGFVLIRPSLTWASQEKPKEVSLIL